MGYEDAPATRMVATYCAVCSKPLVDAKSVETGIGPECRRKYGFNAAMPEEARAEANKIVYRIAMDQDGPFVAEGCNRLREIGFEKLADRILTRTAPVRVQVDGGYLLVSTPYDPRLVAAFQSIPGRRWNRERKVNMVPLSARAAIESMAARFFPGRVTVWPEGARMAA